MRGSVLSRRKQAHLSKLQEKKKSPVPPCGQQLCMVTRTRIPTQAEGRKTRNIKFPEIIERMTTKTRVSSAGLKEAIKYLPSLTLYPNKCPPVTLLNDKITVK